MTFSLKGKNCASSGKCTSVVDRKQLPFINSFSICTISSYSQVIILAETLRCQIILRKTCLLGLCWPPFVSLFLWALEVFLCILKVCMQPPRKVPFNKQRGVASVSTGISSHIFGCQHSPLSCFCSFKAETRKTKLILGWWQNVISPKQTDISLQIPVAEIFRQSAFRQHSTESTKKVLIVPTRV